MSWGEGIQTHRRVRLVFSRLDRDTAGGDEVPHFLLHSVEVKSCARCGTPKPLLAFSPHPNTYDGLQGTCRDCMREVGRQYGAGHRKAS